MAGSLQDISVETVVDMLKKYKNDNKEYEFVKNSLMKGGCPKARILKAESLLNQQKPLFSAPPIFKPSFFSPSQKPLPQKSLPPKPILKVSLTKPESKPFFKPLFNSSSNTTAKPIQKTVVRPVDRTPRTPIPKKNLLYLLGGILLLLIIALIISYSVSNGAKNCGTNEQCFVTEANNCGNVKFTNEVAGAKFSYHTKDCVLEKRVVSLASDEPKEIKKRFEGKSMTCNYSRNAFDRQFITEIAGGIQRCTGDLVDAIVSG